MKEVLNGGYNVHPVPHFSIGIFFQGRALAWRLHPGTKKARKGNVGTSVEWRLNSENDSRLHGQPSFAKKKKSKIHGKLNASWKISFLAVNGQSFLVIDGYLLDLKRGEKKKKQNPWKVECFL